MSQRSIKLTPDILLQAYAAGIFPMAESALSRELRWFDPPLRAIIPLDHNFHVPKRLRRTIRQKPFTLRINTAFGEVIRQCAAPTFERPVTWINREIINLYNTLHHRGFAHSVEVWDRHELIGGLYGVSLGGAFFGESMFSRRDDASKIALVYLVALLRANSYILLDTQFQTDHLARFGTLEITRANYRYLLDRALGKPRTLAFPENQGVWDDWMAELLQPVIHKS